MGLGILGYCLSVIDNPVTYWFCPRLNFWDFKWFSSKPYDLIMFSISSMDGYDEFEEMLISSAYLLYIASFLIGVAFFLFSKWIFNKSLGYYQSVNN